MHIINDICYAGEPVEGIRVANAAGLGRGMMLVTFSTGEKRLFDATLLKGNVFGPLKDDRVLGSVRLFHGIMTRNNGETDIAPETVYELSYPYTEDETRAI